MKYLENYPSMLQNLKLADLQNAAKKVIRPSSFTWVIVGDRAKIEKGIRELNIGALKFLDANGNEIK
jgi:zinc protease